MRAFWALLTLTAVGLATGASALSCESLRFEGNRYAVCEVAPEHEHLRLFLNDPSDQPYGDFSSLETALNADGKTLLFAMNAGMYHDDRAPVGHYVEDGQERMRVIANPGPGNFGLLPNGLLCIQANRADVIETRAYQRQRPDCDFATQSGPMLVIDGELHPRFLPDSTSRYVRNGVGTSADGKRAVFVISDTSVTFYEFARLFRDGLTLPNALFLDGNVSRLFAPSLNRADLGRQMGPIVAVTSE
ncbi:phosphodiester glycosidase family protein [Pacificoceanicola onchidii]|uniref:phosphodiester glycosidase family protein n=1 Tax=Pacificoceanicola onchidii TaxID=2562685 RepID=UPI0010A5BFC3|nr:phosphodiester glycosidase family protein [Pacificoceanicola onchidii]